MSAYIKSFREIISFNDYGRDAREGFEYQDHIGVSLLIEILSKEELKEVWFETLDDIDLIYYDGENEQIEFVQVKHEDIQSRYSIPRIARRKDDRKGTSLFEKSLPLAGCEENTNFRIITSFRVNKKLRYLTFKRDGVSRKAEQESRKEIIEGLKDRCGDIKSTNGTGIEEWVDSCLWDVRPPKIKDVRSRNIHDLNEIVRDKFSKPLFHDQSVDLYQKLLSIVKGASTVDLKHYPGENKVTKQDIFELVQEYLDRLSEPKGLTRGLKNKMGRCGISEDYIKTAVSLREKYAKKRYEVDYMRSSILSDLEGEIMDKLTRLKMKLDNGDLVECIEFHKICYEEVTRIAKRSKYKDQDITEHLAVGLMYQITNRCSHRFDRVKV